MARSSLSRKGLRVLPGLIPEKIQVKLLSSLLHGNLANPQHKTNVHAHYSLPYEACSKPEAPAGSSREASSASFFHLSPESPVPFLPLHHSTHKSFTVRQFLSSKLRWMTLGGQYDWTAKRYPSDKAPTFPKDLAYLVETLFPQVKAEAAIMNVYTPGDFLSVHRDVSEESSNGLISISLGCDGIFIVGIQSDGDLEPQCAIIRLRSGDAILMSGHARFAWHGLPQVMPNTCPGWLLDWPADTECRSPEEDSFAPWRGWMASKRINLSIRQMSS